MNRVLVDTSFLIGLALEDDQLHETALKWHRAVSRQRVITEYVLVELADSLSAEHSRAKAAKMIQQLRASRSVEVVAASQTLLANGLSLYESRRDKQWSLTDCISFVIMKDYGLSDALSADHHFEQAGFRALLRLPVPA